MDSAKSAAIDEEENKSPGFGLETVFGLLAGAAEVATIVLGAAETLLETVQPWIGNESPDQSTATIAAEPPVAGSVPAPAEAALREPPKSPRPPASPRLPEPTQDGELHLLPVDDSQVHLWFRCPEEQRGKALVLRYLDEQHDAVPAGEITLGPHATHAYLERPPPGTSRHVQLGFSDGSGFLACSKVIEIRGKPASLAARSWRDLETGERTADPILPAVTAGEKAPRDG